MMLIIELLVLLNIIQFVCQEIAEDFVERHLFDFMGVQCRKI